MSRGLGRLQRKALLVLWRADGHRVPLGDLKRELAADRSNARRAIRVLLDRGMVKETGPERDLALTGGAVMALFLADYGATELSEERVPGRPLDLDSILADDTPAWEPHASEVTSCKHELYPETRVSDNLGDPHGCDNGPGASSITKLIADALEGHRETKGENK